MQQKESFLQTKKGKIVVGSVTGSIVLLLSILLLCWYKEVWPFSPKITDKNVEDLQKDLNDNDKSMSDRYTTLTNFIDDKVKKVNDNLADKDSSKKIKFEKIDVVKNQLTDLKAKDKDKITETDKTNLKKAVDALADYLKEAAKEINK